MTTKEQYNEAFRLWRKYGINSNPQWHNVRSASPVSDEIMHAANIAWRMSIIRFEGTMKITRNLRRFA